MRIDILKATNTNEIREKVFRALEDFKDLLPASASAKILIKPNLNSNMNALTGNTTDLRLLAAVVLFLKDRGYEKITIGEGTNSGFYRNRISVISRLQVDRLARHCGVGVIDLNRSRPVVIDLKNGVKAQMAEECFEADLFINLPKLKTHFEVGMSVCLKNLMGCLVGQENKKKAHDALAENILLLNQAVKPHLHIVDALVAMEGLGPTRGTPIRLDTIVVGTDPYLIDLLCCRMAGFSHEKVRTLAVAEKKGLLTDVHHRIVRDLIGESPARPFRPPNPGPLAAFIHHPDRQKFFLKIRNTSLFTRLAASDWFGGLLFRTGLRQDVFVRKEMRIDRMALDEGRCDRCGVCRDVCPMGRFFPDDFRDPGACLQCLYCYAACPKHAISYSGEAGFFAEQERQYDCLIRALFQEPRSPSSGT